MQGLLGEKIAEDLFKEIDNATVLNLKINNSNHGFDVLQFETNINTPSTIRIIESKSMRGSSVELPPTNNGVQMGADWIGAKIEQMRVSTNANLQGLGNILFQNQAKIERYFLTIEKDLKQVIILKLDNFK